MPPRDPADPQPIPFNPPPATGGRPGPFPPQPARMPPAQFPPPPGPQFPPATGSFPRLPAAPASGMPMSGAPMSGPGVGAPPPPPRRVKGTGGLMMILIAVALVSSLTAVALSVYAIGTANDAKTTAAPAAGGPAVNVNPTAPKAAATTTTTTAAKQPTKTPAVKASAGELDPKAEFTEAYTPSTKKLTLHPEQSGTRAIDLDKPEVGVENDRADLNLYSYNGEFFLFPNNVKAATAPNPDVQANDCAELIPSSSLPNDAKISVNTPDLTLCLVTSFEAAQRQGLSWKLVLIHVTSVSTDGTVNVDLKAWNIPL